MTRRPTAPKPRPTKLEVRQDLRDGYALLGVPDDAWPDVIDREQAKGTTQAEFDAGLEAQLDKDLKARAEAHAANEAAKAEAEAAERKANRTALAGMALQGILASPDDKFGNDFYGLVNLAVEYTDALLDALDKPVGPA